MNSTFFVGWKGFYGSVLVTVIMFFCFLGVSSSQEDSLDQVTIEQTLMNALPMQADLAPGMPWEYYDGPLFRWISGDLCYATASWDADVKRRRRTRAASCGASKAPPHKNGTKSS